MARPKKTGFDYFPFDVDLFSDYKVRKLMRHQGGSQAVAVYALLLCNIYRNGYYLRWDDELPFFMSETLGLKEAYINEVINYCTAVGLISKELYDKEKILTSAGIQKRYLLICQQARRASVINEYSLISSEETPVSSAKTPVSSEETKVITEETPVSSVISTQSKVKESKVKESKGNNPPQTPPGELRGGGFNWFVSVENNTIRTMLSRAGVSDNDAWEFLRLMSAPEVPDGYALSVAEKYCAGSAEERKEHPFFLIIQAHQSYEEQKRINPMPYREFQTRLFLNRNCLGSDQATITAMADSDPRLFDELQKAVAEILRPGSNILHPGKYIIAQLRKLQSTLNHQRLIK